ncbi:MAG: dTMP kinase [Alphaproteobacteria bacterium]|nr:dTMP kinase [Alphaproteobacteria bacterium]MBU1525762.1 dTMP kinase [Alphaproteobacteria bacterium]MBU2116218.1 dTMP kinase [Alphaproteobacteria bacterium]MBU2351052.1 dTMP kinase [Alphaproteobacteria bacterium]MBU2383104.1 dTMP kinase [Alphaproteobacteria bacterium]
MSRGRFITFEGGEGAGKSTQARRLADVLRARGHDVVLTREPGGSPGGERIRALVVSGQAADWSPLTETLLMFAARDDHLNAVIRPALAAGKWVVCDRFSDSTRAYQGAAGGVDPAVVEALDAAVVGADQPDLTLVFDLPANLGLSRALARGEGETRFESKGADFHDRLAAAFRRIAAAHPERCRLIDADGDVDVVAARVLAAVEAAGA